MWQCLFVNDRDEGKLHVSGPADLLLVLAQIVLLSPNGSCLFKHFSVISIAGRGSFVGFRIFYCFSCFFIEGVDETVAEAEVISKLLFLGRVKL